MSKLYFKVASDWQEVVKLRTEISKLEAQIKSMDANKAPQAVAVLNNQMQQAKQQMNGMITEAAKAGAVMENDFKSKIYQGSQSVNDFTQKIIAQRSAIGTLQTTIRKNKDLYKTITSTGGGDGILLRRIREQEKALGKEKDALFNLTQQQANAHLSVKKLRDEYVLYKNDAKGVSNANSGMSMSFGKMLGVIGGVAAIKQLGSEIVRVRGEFQSMQTAIETLVGKDMAGNLIPQIKELAKVSPLTLTDMVGAEKMMLGFNIKAEDTIRYLQALGDISMGNSGKFNSLTLAFSQTSAAGKLMGQDLNQMINAGFNPLQQISLTTGKSIAQLKDEMSKGAISAEMVQKAFVDATSAGGKFFGMSENASKTINGQISMMQDAMDEAFNEMGQKSEGVIMSGIQLTTKLVENYETVGKILSGLVVTYGAYRAAVMLSTIATGKHTIAEVALTNVRVMARRAQMALNSAMLTNPYVLLAVAVGGLVTANLTLLDSNRQLKAAEDEYNSTKAEAIEKERKHKQEIENLLSVASNEKAITGDRKDALVKLIQKYPAIFEKYKTETEMLQHILDIHKEIDKYENNRSAGTPDNKLNDVDKQIADLEKLAKERYHGGRGLTNAENAKLMMLKNKRSELAGIINKQETDAILADLTGYSNSQIEAAIEDRERLLARMQLKGVNKGTITGKSILSGTFSKEELEGQKKLLEIALIKPTTYNEDYEETKKEWESAKKALAEIEKDKSQFTSKQYKEAKALKETTEKKYKDLGGITGSALSKQESAAAKQKKEQQKLSDELLSLRRQNQQEEINLMKDGSETKLKQIELDYQKEIDAIKKQEKEWSEKQGGKLTQEQSVEISARYTNADNKKDKGITDTTKEQLKVEQQALNQYLEKYGTFQQQKLAIAQEYAEKIRKAQEENGINSAQVKLLQREQKEKSSAIDTAAIKANIDWVAVFGEFGGMFTDMIKPALEEAKKYAKTDQFKNSDQASQKSLIDAINQMEKSLGGAGGVNFKKLGQEVQVYQNSLRELNVAKNEETEAIDKLKKAQEDYEKAIKNGTEQEKQAAMDALDNAQDNANAASSNVKTQTDIVNQNQQGLSDTATNLKANMDNVADGLSKLASGGIKNAYDGLIQAGKGMGGAMEKVADSLEDVPIIGWIVSIIDVFKDGLSNLVGGLLDAVFNAVGGIIGDVLSGDLFVTIGKSVASGVGNILNSISFGGFDSLFGIGGNAKETAEKIDSLTASNDALKTSIDGLKDEIAGTNGAKSIQAYSEAVEAQGRYEENMRQILDAQMGYSSAHHSNAYYWDLDKNSLSQVNKLLGTSLNNTWSDFSKLTADQMNEIRTHLPDVWSEMINEGKYGDRFKEDWENYADQAGQLQEMTDELRENLAQVSFDSLRDSFVDALMDMDTKAEDFAKDFEEYMTRALLNFAVGDKMDENLQNWYNSWADTMNAQNGKLTEKQIEDYRSQWDAFVQEGLKTRDEIAELTGYTGSSSSSSQNSTKGGFQSMSQDTGNELNGRFTALQIAGEEIKNQNILQSQSLNILTMKSDAILTVNTEIKNIADETRTILANSYLELQDIRENTGAIVKPIIQMQKDMEEVKKNTSKL